MINHKNWVLLTMLILFNGKSIIVEKITKVKL
jgi:hypothetical protein